MKPNIFNPHTMSAEESRDTFIARKNIFSLLMQDIGNHAAADVPQHNLVIGLRGMGKTTLLHRIAVELSEQDYNDKFIGLTFPEEQHVEIDRLSKLWLNCLDSLADALEKENDYTAAGKIDDQVTRLGKERSDETTFAEQSFAAFKGAYEAIERRPVLLVDNFNLLLERLRNDDYNLRGIFSKRGAPILVSASTVFPKQTGDYGAAFYDGFKTHYLNPLSLDEVCDIFVQLAIASNRTNLVDRIYQERPKIAALQTLTGGNPRTAVLLFDIFAAGFSEDAYEDLEELLDIVTPLYQSRLEQLSDQSQVIVGAIARQWAPITRVQIADHAHINSSSIPAPLNRMKDIGLIEETQLFNSKKPGYQIAERFFNIWYLMRFTTRRRRSGLICLARFLELFHTPEERLSSARSLAQRVKLSDGNIKYALALAQSIEGSVESLQLDKHAQLELYRRHQVERTDISAILDLREIDTDVKRFHRMLLGLSKPRSTLARKFGVSATTWFTEVVDENSMSFLTDLDFTKKILLDTPSQNHFGVAVSFIDCIESTDNKETALRLASEIDDQHPAPWNGFGYLYQLDLKRYDEAEVAYRKAIELDPNWASPWNALGHLYRYDLKRYDEAEAAYRKAIELDPDWASPWNGLGDLYQDYLKRYDEAEAAYRKAIELDHTWAAPWGRNGDLYKRHLKRYDKAEAAYRKAIELDPDWAYPWNALGHLYQYDSKRYDEAEAAYRKAIELDPDWASLWNALGHLYKNHLKRYDEAEVAYRKAIELDSDWASPWNALGHLYQYDLKRYDEAEVAYRKAIELDPERASPWGGLGDLYQDYLKRYDEAEAAYRKAIELDPERASPWNVLGHLYQYDLKRYDGAEVAYRKAIELDPDWASPWNALGHLYQYDLKRYDEAEVAYRKAIELDPERASPWGGLGDLYQDLLKRYDEAEAAYRKAIELDPDWASLWNALGHLYQYDLKRYDGAEVAYRKAIELDPDWASLWNALGHLYQYDLKRYDEAEVAYRKAIELDPERASPWGGLGDLYQDHLKRYDEAEAAYRKAIELNPDEGRPWVALGHLYQYDLKRYDEAEVAYRKAIEFNPDWASLWNSLGNLLSDYLHEPKKAEQIYRSALKLSPKDSTVRTNLIFLLRDQLLKVEDAFGLHSISLEYGSDMNDAHFLNSALFECYKDNWGSAVKYLQDALSETQMMLPPNTRDDWFRFAAVVLHLGMGHKLVTEFKSSGVETQLMPYVSAIEACIVGDRRLMQNIPVEARDVAGSIFDEIQQRLRILPNESKVAGR